MTGGSRNVGASVRDRLLRIAREQGEDFQLLLIRYANERLLHRVAESPFGRKFVLKGATHMLQWEDPSGIAAGLIAFLARHPIA